MAAKAVNTATLWYSIILCTGTMSVRGSSDWLRTSHMYITSIHLNTNFLSLLMLHDVEVNTRPIEMIYISNTSNAGEHFHVETAN